jgi:hypothetical protein
MPLWGTTHDAITNKPKWLPVDENSDNRKADVYATNAGWVQAAGSAASGNDSTTADPEVLVAIGMLAGASATTGLKTPTITSFRFSPGTTGVTDHTAGTSSQRVSVTITWDEAITVTGNPTILISNTVSADHTCVYVSGTGTNRLIFRVANQTLAAGDVMTIGGANVVLAGGTLKDQGGTPADASLVMSGVTAVTHTVLA